MVCGAGAQGRRSEEETSGRRSAARWKRRKKRQRGMCNGCQIWLISTNSIKLEFSEHPLRCSMELVELGARSMFFADLEFLEPKRLARKIWNEVVF